MSTEPLDTAPAPLPELDEETRALAQQLFALARAGDTERLARLLEMGLVPNLRDATGNSLLMLASYHEHAGTTRLLLEHGGDPELPNDRGQTPLAGAAFKGNPEIARLLVEHGADVNARTPDGKTALMFAAMFNRTEIVELLLEHGADAGLRTDDGVTAQGLAESMGAGAAAARLARVTG